jgi:hypothetical protein
MIIKLIAWIPYRILGFVGLYPKNTLSGEVVSGNLISFLDFLTGSFTTDKWAGLILISLVFFFLAIRKRRTLVEPILLLFLVFGYGAIFIHGAPPYHYYLPLYPVVIILAALVLAKLFRGKLWPLPIGLIILLTFFNLKFYFSTSWFYQPQDKILEGRRVPYRMQLEVVEKIIIDAKGQKFSLARIGPYDYFEGNFAQNYEYLLWWQGNNPVENASLKYTIAESTEGIYLQKELK